MRTFLGSIMCAVVATALLVSAPTAASAQSAQGGLRGTVKDAQSPIPGVTVTLVNETNGVTRDTATNGVGEYSFPALEPGSYVVRVGLQGFKTFERKGVVINTQSFMELDVTLEIGTLEESITVTGQSPASGITVVEGTQVRINVSQGPKPVSVPNVVGLPYDQAASELQRAGFNVSRIDEDSDQAAGIVTRQTPSGGSEGSKGSTVTVTVSKGPSTSAVPDVTTQDVAIAQTTLEAAGFRTRVVLEDTDDPTFDSIVISQDPVGGTQAKPNSLVTLFVGRFVQATTTTTTTP